MHYYFKTTSIMFTIMITFTLFSGCFAGQRNPADKVGQHLETIKTIHDKFSREKIIVSLAAKKIFAQMMAIQKLNESIPDTEPMKDFLETFLDHWTTEEQIQISITDGKNLFMTEVNVFFVRGYVKYKDGWRTLFPLFKP